MNKDVLIKQVAEKIEEATQKDVKLFLDTIIETIEENVAAGESVKIAGFGTFTVTERKARTARNPRTGQVIDVASSKSPKFKPSKSFKDLVKA
jgi:DNA-binding protein HU-beta